MNDTEYTKETIQQMIRTNQKWLEKALIVLFNRQTEDEQESEHTQHLNGVGFSGTDSRYLTYCTKYILQSSKPLGQKLSGRHLEKCRKIVPKYWKQIKDEIERKQRQGSN